MNIIDIKMMLNISIYMIIILRFVIGKCA